MTKTTTITTDLDDGDGDDDYDDDDGDDNSESGHWLRAHSIPHNSHLTLNKNCQHLKKYTPNSIKNSERKIELLFLPLILFFALAVSLKCKINLAFMCIMLVSWWNAFKMQMPFMVKFKYPTIVTLAHGSKCKSSLYYYLKFNAQKPLFG